MKKRDILRCQKLLVAQREEILASVTKGSKAGEIHLDPDDFPDEMDTAASESALAFQGRLRERERMLLSKINESLEKIEQGEFGECESCGEDIGLKRLLARPVAGLCIDCKSEQERREQREA